MNNITDEQRDQCYEKADQIFKRLYGSAESGRVLRAAFAAADLDESVYIRYVNVVGDVILGFHKTTDLPRLFQSELEMGADDSQRLLSDLLEFLTPVIAREEKAAGEKKASMMKLADAIETKPEAKEPETAPAPSSESESPSGWASESDPEPTPTPETETESDTPSEEPAPAPASSPQWGSATDDEPTKTPETTDIEAAPVETTPVTPASALRTMEGDVNRIHGYGAYRAAENSTSDQDVPEEGDTAADETVHVAQTQTDILEATPAPKLPERSAADFLATTPDTTVDTAPVEVEPEDATKTAVPVRSLKPDSITTPKPEATITPPTMPAPETSKPAPEAPVPAAPDTPPIEAITETEPLTAGTIPVNPIPDAAPVGASIQQSESAEPMDLDSLPVKPVQ